ncbi:unnamed protein product [Kuraishia capsulata CBS 1993]|uniref:GP-PDE domain-containing protein n=1 Tax=Kuraishia capsulata CBS 1993 TaxID=1382522 RepID=W6MMF4_9ASCO|nr:uncharacterized protein KUCA_T00002068001 [Kuraishia capsulata CBS 1993]CDK26097.1 unnamed protein product [Kuraishia capsulata CBS 1993]
MPLIEVLTRFRYRKLFPENTITAFQQAVIAGSTVIETDVHVSKDGVVVICHDLQTGRTFDKDYNIKEVEYFPTLQALKCKSDPDEHMPTLKETLEWLNTTPTLIKLMLDIKGDNDAQSIGKIIISECKAVNPDISFWQDRIIFGLWDSSFYHKDVLDGFEVINITFSPARASKFLKDVDEKGGSIQALSMMYLVCYQPFLKSQMLALVKKYNLKLYFWTVNSPLDMSALTDTLDPSICEGFVSDDPKAVSQFLSGEHKPPVTLVRLLRNFALSSVLWGVITLIGWGYNARPILVKLQRRGWI